MTNVTLNRKELCKFVGKEIGMQELQDTLFELGIETEEVKGEEVTLELNPDRPDLLSVEGIARLLRYYYGIDKTHGNKVSGAAEKRSFSREMKIPEIEKSDYLVTVDPKISKMERKHIGFAALKGIKFDSEFIVSSMQLQDKLAATVGRKRRKVAMGVYDLDKIKFPLSYTVVSENDKFIPMGHSVEMKVSQLVKEHIRGREYAYLIEGWKEFTAYKDAEGKILCVIPITQADFTKVTEKTKNILIEVTGTDKQAVSQILNILVENWKGYGKLYSVKIKYPDGAEITPNLKPRETEIEADYVNKVLGTEFGSSDIIKLLAKSGFDSQAAGKKIKVFIPPYRADILHKRDIVDDIGRAYGFNNLQPSYPKTATMGELSEGTKLGSAARDVLIGCGFQDLLNFIMTDKDSNYKKMNVKEDGKAVELANPYSEQYTIMRTWLLPSLMAVLSNNTRRKYPQNISEVGKAAILDAKENLGSKEPERVAAVTCHLNAQYNEIKSKLQILAQAFDVEMETTPAKHESFIEGRCARILINKKDVGIIGEIHPSVLQNWGIEMPAAAFEIELNALKK